MSTNLNTINALRENAETRERAMTRAEERRLIAAARAGDRGAMDRLVAVLSAPVFRYGRSFCGNSTDAEDVMQDTLSAMARGLGSFREAASLTTWAYVVARNACTRMRRHRRREVADTGALAAEARSAAASVASDPARAAERGQLAEALSAAIRDLPHTLREPLVLRDVEGLSAAEAARVLRIGERALKSRLHRARVALRDRLASWEEGEHRPPRAPVRTPRRRGRVAPAGATATAITTTSPRADGPCPDLADLLSRHLESDLDASTCARLEAHVSTCPHCAAACEAFRDTLATCRRSGRERPPLPVRRAVRSAIRRAFAQAKRSA